MNTTVKSANTSASNLSLKKQILSDPIRYFSSYQVDNAESLAAIKTLWQQRQSLEEQQKAIQAKTGSLSRQIGEARRNKQTTDTLIISMQAASTENKTLLEQIKQINQEILNHFTLQPASPDPLNIAQRNTDKVHNDDARKSNKRHYSTAPTNINDVHISLFEKTGDPDEWNHYVAYNSAACIHHKAEWRNILSQSYGHESLYLCARDANQCIVGILPLIHMKSRLFGNKLVSMPFFQRGGAIADHPLIEQKLIQTATAYGKKLGVDHIEYRDDIPRKHLPEPFASQTHKVNMVLSLPDAEQTLWQGFTAKLRSQIRRPQREQARVFIGGREYLNDFYTVYSRNMRDLGSPVQSKHFIDNILLHFPQNSWLIVIKLDQRPVAAGFLLGSGDTMEIPLASTIREVNSLSINMLLYWEALKFAIKQNYSQFDFGRSSKNAGTYRFKQQWGAQPKQLYWHYWLGHSKALPSLNPSNPKYALIISVWKRLPVALANLLGPAIVKNIP
ncbi:MAG: FemAB family PEP-CTERM system-associated protein [Gammaproteobacteria bacterium]|nr:FemAB family PEP-CTERM system-associated protein [Gammaproteobacteria bacterium]